MEPALPELDVISTDVSLGQPEVLFQAPDPAVASSYAWVPLLHSVYVGSNRISGYWCLHSAKSCLQAFRAYMQRQDGRTNGVLTAPILRSRAVGYGLHRRRLWSPQNASGNVTYNEVLSEIQGMQAQIGAHVMASHGVYDQVLREHPLLPASTPGRPLRANR
jgi:hypothetical protein